MVLSRGIPLASRHRTGSILEARSKLELLLVISCLYKGNPEALVICNGLKDAKYISLTLVTRKIALNIVIVLQQKNVHSIRVNNAYWKDIKNSMGRT
ncbi:PLP-binding barrel [Sesbania bispinosa]|nr:PLP-binding barrel [Sesbania bispinosa]